MAMSFPPSSTTVPEWLLSAKEVITGENAKCSDVRHLKANRLERKVTSKAYVIREADPIHEPTRCLAAKEARAQSRSAFILSAWSDHCYLLSTFLGGFTPMEVELDARLMAGELSRLPTAS